MIINWSKLDLRECDALVAEEFDLIDDKLPRPYKMCDGQPIWGSQATCPHFTTAWSGMRQVIEALRAEWRHNCLDQKWLMQEYGIDRWEVTIEAELEEDNVVTIADTLPEAICQAAMIYHGHVLH